MVKRKKKDGTQVVSTRYTHAELAHIDRERKRHNLSRAEYVRLMTLEFTAETVVG